MERIVIESGECKICFLNNNNKIYQCGFNTTEDFDEVNNAPCFQLKAAGSTEGALTGITNCYTLLPEAFESNQIVQTGNALKIEFINKTDMLIVTVEYEPVQKSNGFVITTKIKNIGKNSTTATYLSAASLTGIGKGGLLKWNDKRKISVSYFQSTWQGEAQYRTNSLEQLGLYRNSVHPNASTIKINSQGSWSTGKYIPIFVIEDNETGKIWFSQTDISANWEFELCHRGLWNKESGVLTLLVSNINEKNGGFVKSLDPDEEFECARTFMGCCSGDINMAAKSLTNYRRSIVSQNQIGTKAMPAFFNDYMNCLWGNPTADKLIPLIDAASKVGMEGFCIDAGWFMPDHCDGMVLGDWNPSKDRFGDDRLEGIIRYIQSKNMIPGLWLEMEMCSQDALLYQMPDDFFLMRNGKRVGGSERVPLNFTNPKVREYLHGKIDRLVEMGVGFFKNDYNMCVGIGDDTFSSAGDGLMKNCRAFYSFIKEIKKRHNHVLIENCGSGAMRQDYGILSLCDLQSISDQEEYEFMPSILLGQLFCVLPEQLGVWAYPIPLLFLEKQTPEILDSEDYIKKMADGEQTIFNMVSGLCGTLYLSGRIDKADTKNLKLISEATSVYKSQRDFIRQAYPYYPKGFINIENQQTTAVFGLLSEDSRRMVLYCWRLNDAEDYLPIDLLIYKNQEIKIKQIYPSAEEYQESFVWNPNSGKLTVHMKKQYTARMFEINL